MIYTCQRCAAQFEREPKKAGYKFCTQRCANLRQIKVKAERLRPYAELGSRAGYIAMRLGVNSSTLRRALNETGLYTLWASRRYKKCAVVA